MLCFQTIYLEAFFHDQFLKCIDYICTERHDDCVRFSVVDGLYFRRNATPNRFKLVNDEITTSNTSLEPLTSIRSERSKETSREKKRNRAVEGGNSKARVKPEKIDSQISLGNFRYYIIIRLDLGLRFAA